MKPVQRYRALRRASLKGLQAFEAAYMHRSFASAAQELSITASAVSHAIQTLEEALGTVLFERERRGVVPTAAGARLFEVTRRSFSDIDDELRTILDASTVQQVVTIQSAPSFAAIWIMPRLPAFLRAHPDLDVRLWAVHQAPDFSNGGVDVAVTYGRTPPSGSVHSEPVSRRERYLPVCSPALVDGWTLPLPASDIEQFYLIQNDVSLTSWDEWIGRFAPGYDRAVQGLRLDRAFMTLSAAENGLGMCIESTVLVQDYVKQGKLVCPFGDLAIDVMAHYISVPKNKEHLQGVQTVLAWLRGFVNQDEVEAWVSGE
ncbi:MAG: LysR substrate-binding domain-containing protein [Pseudomonadota bacterium]